MSQDPITPLRVWYLFNTPREKLVQQATSAQTPDNYYALYGLRQMTDLGIEASYGDKGFSHSRLVRGSNMVIGKIAASFSGVGFNLFQALRLLPDLRLCDVIYATADSCALPVALLKRLGLIRTPLVYQSIGLTTLIRQSQAIRSFYRWLVASAERIVVCSPTEASEWQDIFGIPAQRISCIPNSVDTEYFAPTYQPREEWILSVGRDRRRDYSTLSQAIAGTGIKLKIVTTPEIGQQLPATPDVELLYNIRLTDLRALYAQAACVVVPCQENSYAAGNTVVLQAMAMGKAVIYSDTAGIRAGYSLADGVNCRLVPPGDVMTLRQAILQVMHDSALATRLGRAARRTVEKRFASRQRAEALAALFRSVARATEQTRRS